MLSQKITHNKTLLPEEVVCHLFVDDVVVVAEDFSTVGGVQTPTLNVELLFG